VLVEYRIVKYRGKLAAEWHEDGKRHRRSLGTNDIDQASAELQRIDAERAASSRPAVMTVADVARGYRRSLDGKASAVTFDHQWKAIGPHFGRLAAESVSEGDCRAYAAKRKGRSEWTIHSELGRLRSALSWADKRGLINKAPHIWRNPEPPPRDKRLTREQAQKFFGACELPHVRLFVTLAMTTGARMGALLDLTWDRIDFERRKIILHDPERRPAGKSRATVPMNRTAEKALREAQEGATGRFVIEWGRGKVASVKKSLRAAGLRCGLPWVTAHVFRHSAACWLAEDGVPMEEIAQLLGHSDVRVTRKIYARFSPDHLHGAASSLEMKG
jgi:integrase